MFFFVSRFPCLCHVLFCHPISFATALPNNGLFPFSFATVLPNNVIFCFPLLLPLCYTRVFYFAFLVLPLCYPTLYYFASLCSCNCVTQQCTIFIANVLLNQCTTLTFLPPIPPPLPSFATVLPNNVHFCRHSPFVTVSPINEFMSSPFFLLRYYISVQDYYYIFHLLISTSAVIIYARFDSTSKSLFLLSAHCVSFVSPVAPTRTCVIYTYLLSVSRIHTF